MGRYVTRRGSPSLRYKHPVPVHRTRRINRDIFCLGTANNQSMVISDACCGFWDSLAKYRPQHRPTSPRANPHLETHDQINKSKDMTHWAWQERRSPKLLLQGECFTTKSASQAEMSHLQPARLVHRLTGSSRNFNAIPGRPSAPKSRGCRNPIAPLVGIAAVARADLMAGAEFDVRKANLLRQCLGQMGATPADASKIAMPDEDAPEDPADKYFA